MLTILDDFLYSKWPSFTYKERQISKKSQAVTVCNVLIGHGKIVHSPNFIGKYKSKVPMINT